MRLILAWLLDQRSTVAGIIACILLLITVVLRYGFDLWWPFGIVMATVCAIVAIIGVGRDEPRYPDHPRQIPRRTACHAGAIPQRRGSATRRNPPAARSANGPRRALLLPADLPGYDRPPRGAATGGRQTAKRLRHRRGHGTPRQPARPLRAGRAHPLGQRAPSRPVVQSALHGGEVQDRASA